MCEEEARVVQMRPVEKAALDLSGPVVDSVSCVLGVDAGGVSSGVVGGRYVSVGDDMELCGVNTNDYTE